LALLPLKPVATPAAETEPSAFLVKFPSRVEVRPSERVVVALIVPVPEAASNLRSAVREPVWPF
jgi:hypothetical protein